MLGFSLNHVNERGPWVEVPTVLYLELVSSTPTPNMLSKRVLNTRIIAYILLFHCRLWCLIPLPPVLNRAGQSNFRKLKKNNHISMHNFSA